MSGSTVTTMSGSTITTQSLIENGFLTAAKMGRPRIYATDEERHKAHREQQRICYKRWYDRKRDAIKQMCDDASFKAMEMPSGDIQKATTSPQSIQ